MSETILPLALGASFIGFMVTLDKLSKTEKFGMDYPPTRQLQQTPQNKVHPGDQLLEWQLYQQAINAATPTLNQLDSISGVSDEQGNELDGKPLNYQSVALGSQRADQVSACAQNAPTFIATSLLPKAMIPGQEAWDTVPQDNVLASQNFLSAMQQIGVDTVSQSNKNASYDIRGTIPVTMNVVSPWGNSSWIEPLQQRPLQCGVPDNGLYGCNGLNADPNRYSSVDN